MLNATAFVDRLGDSFHRLHEELTKLGRYPLLVIDEVGYIPFEAEAANCSSSWRPPATNGQRHRHIHQAHRSLARGRRRRRGRPQHDRSSHAPREVVSLKGDSYRLNDRDLGRVPTDGDGA